jgi:hypothetical protein
MDKNSQIRTVRISCTGTDFVDFTRLRSLQGNLKVRNKTDIDKIIKSIILHGFSFPFFVWKDGKKSYVFDWHGRTKALSEMQKTRYAVDKDNNLITEDGPPWTVPLLPAVYIEAKTVDEAKEKLLKLNSRYGMITDASFKLFTDGLKAVDLSGISINFEKLTFKAPEIRLPLQTDGAEHAGPPSYSPNLEPDIGAETVSEKELKKTDAALGTAMLDRGKVETVELCCPLCGEGYSIKISDALALIEEAGR